MTVRARDDSGPCSCTQIAGVMSANPCNCWVLWVYSMPDVENFPCGQGFHGTAESVDPRIVNEHGGLRNQVTDPVSDDPKIAPKKIPKKFPK